MFTLLFLASCASNSQLTLSPRTEEVPPMGSGEEMPQPVTVQLVTPDVSNEVEELPSFILTVRNGSEESIEFFTSQIKVFSGDQEVRLYNPVNLAARIQEKIEKDAQEYTGQQAEVFLQSDITRGDPSSAMASISAAKSANLAAAERESRERMTQEVGKLFRSTEIPADGLARGLVKLYYEDILPEAPLTFQVTVAGETYERVFDVE